LPSLQAQQLLLILAQTTYFNRSFLFSLGGMVTFFVSKYNMANGRWPIIFSYS
jgi:hypothetical protein